MRFWVYSSSKDDGVGALVFSSGVGVGVTGDVGIVVGLDLGSETRVGAGDDGNSIGTTGDETVSIGVSVGVVGEIRAGIGSGPVQAVRNAIIAKRATQSFNTITP